MATGVSRSSKSRGAVWILALSLGAPACAGSLRVTVVDEHGPVAHVAVYAVPSKPATLASGTPNAIMDQAHNAFVPHILIVQTGTSVLFPNNDVVSHHVYSFSQAKTFELALYKGNTHPPLAFDEPGVVVLGCNIHDSMLGYIVVVPTEHYALSDERGAVRLEGVPAGDYTVEVWTPRARPTGLPAAQRVTVTDDVTKVTALITGRLAPEQDHKHASKSLSWDRY
jgi:plastocyanin